MGTNPGGKKTDITVYGATSFVAKHVLRYLAQVIPTLTDIQEIRITLGGRSSSKLEVLQKELFPVSSNSPNIIVDTYVASGSDLDLLQQMAQRTKVVINCAGPYSKYSNLVVQACAEMGTHYVDFTGEAYWNAVMRQKYGSTSQKSGARIISMCGYDSIPTDLSVFAAVQALREELGKEQKKEEDGTSSSSSVHVQEIKIWHEAMGMANGGTIHTALDYEWDPISDFTVKDSQQQHRLRNVPFFVGDPLMLTHPESVRHNLNFNEHKDSFAMGEWLNNLISIDPSFSYGVSMPMLMAVINLKVVQASAIALNYGSKDLIIRERMLPLGFSWTRRLSIFAFFLIFWFQIAMLVCLGILKIPIVGKFLCDYLAPPGSGAPDWLVDLGSCATYVEVISSDSSTKNGTVNRGYAHLSFLGDPGNAVTAQCVCESALALLLDEKNLPPNSLDGFGTPAELLGDALLNRFRKTSIRPVKLHTTAKIGVPKNDTKVYL